MEPPPSLKLGFVVGLGLALAGRWVNSWVGALAILFGVSMMLYANRKTTPRANPGVDAPLGLQQ